MDFVSGNTVSKTNQFKTSKQEDWQQSYKHSIKD